MKTATKKKTITKPMGEVVREVTERAPDLAPHLEADRDWLWYAGPSLQKAPDKRKIIREIGFSFAPRGHAMPESGRTAYWGHHCERPVKRRYKGTRRKEHGNDSDDEDSEKDELTAFLSKLG